MANEKFIIQHSVGGEIGKKTDNSKLGTDFLNAEKTKPIPHKLGINPTPQNNTNTNKETETTDQKNESIIKPPVEYQQIKIDEITPRCINKYRQSRIEQLAKSIENTNNRLIHPIVVVRAKDLPKEHEVRKELEKQGVNIDDLNYIIVSGERRYHAWQLLREKAVTKVGKNNPFDYITANVLTRTEALNEKAFYADANNQARHMTPAEAVWFIKDALKEVSTEEGKRKALIMMNGNSEEGIPKDPKEAAKLFRVDSYCSFVLEREMGITDWSDGTLRNMATVAANCDDSVVDALLSGEFILREAKAIAPLSNDNQIKLLQLFKVDRDQYNALLYEIKNKEQRKPSKVTHADTRRQLKATLKRLKTERLVLEKYAGSLGSKYNRNELDAIRKYDAFIDDLAQLIENTK